MQFSLKKKKQVSLLPPRVVEGNCQTCLINCESGFLVYIPFGIYRVKGSYWTTWGIEHLITKLVLHQRAPLNSCTYNSLVIDPRFSSSFSPSDGDSSFTTYQQLAFRTIGFPCTKLILLQSISSGRMWLQPNKVISFAIINYHFRHFLFPCYQ